MQRSECWIWSQVQVTSDWWQSPPLQDLLVCTVQHCSTALHCTALHCTAALQHCSTAALQHCTALHCSTAALQHCRLRCSLLNNTLVIYCSWSQGCHCSWLPVSVSWQHGVGWLSAGVFRSGGTEVGWAPSQQRGMGMLFWAASGQTGSMADWLVDRLVAWQTGWWTGW